LVRIFLKVIVKGVVQIMNSVEEEQRQVFGL
jgi:hypothetical protein